MVQAARCPYCRTDLDGREPEVACARCRTPHHRACWEEHGRCVVLACGEKRPLRGRTDTRRRDLGAVGGPKRHPFLVRGGRQRGEPRWLEVWEGERAHTYRGGARIDVELTPELVEPGEPVEALIAVRLPEAVKVRGLRLGIRAEKIRPLSLTPTTLLDREAAILGHPWEGYFVAARVAIDKVVGADRSELELVEIPQGTTRFRARFVLDPLHPRRGSFGEGTSIGTDVYCYADIPAAPDLVGRAPLHVRRVPS